MHQPILNQEKNRRQAPKHNLFTQTSINVNKKADVFFVYFHSLFVIIDLIKFWFLVVFLIEIMIRTVLLISHTEAFFDLRMLFVLCIDLH